MSYNNAFSNWGVPQQPTGTSLYSSMGSNTGQLGTGTFNPVQTAEMFSQPMSPMDWAATALQGANGTGFNSGATTMNALPTVEPSLFDNMLGKDGWGGMALGAANGLMSSFLGMKNYGLAKKSLAENKRQFGLNYGAQKQAFNNQLLGRANDLYSASGGKGQTPDEYMAQRKIA